MSVICSNCGRENAAGMKFCTNCGNKLETAPAPAAPAPPANFPAANFPAAVPPAAAAKSNKNLLIFGGLGCLALLLVSAVGVVALIYAFSGGGQNANSANLISVNTNSISVNRNSAANANLASKPANVNDNTNTVEDPSDIPIILPETIGTYEQTNTATVNPVDEFPGSLEVTKTNYAKGTRKADVVFAKFASPTTAKEGFEYFLNGQKSAGAKVLVRQKLKNKSGVVNGEAAVYRSKNLYEILFYADKYGFRINSKDRAALQDFATQFGKAVKGIEGLE